MTTANQVNVHIGQQATDFLSSFSSPLPPTNNFAAVDAHTQQLANQWLQACNDHFAVQFKAFDANGQAFLRQMLEEYEAQTYRTQFRPRNFRTMFPVLTNFNPWKDYIKTKVLDRTGEARVIGERANDVPIVTTDLSEVESRVVTIAAAYAYSYSDMQRAAQFGEPLEENEAWAVGEAIEDKMQNLVWYGDEPNRVIGIQNNPNIPISAVPDPGSGTEWENKTPHEILLDITSMFTDVQEITELNENPTKLAMSQNRKNYLTTTMFTSAVGNENGLSVMNWLISQSDFINSADDIVVAQELKDFGPGGEECMMSYNPTPDRMGTVITLDRIYLESQLQGLLYKTPSIARFGGFKVRRPLSMDIKYGI